MAISINYIYQLCYSIAAKQSAAFPSPNDFNMYADMANIDLFNYYNDERQKLLLEVKSGQQIFAPELLADFVVNEYPMSPSVMSPSLPNDYVYDISFTRNINGVNKTITKVPYNKRPSYLVSTIDAPTLSDPIYIELANNMELYPTINTPTYLTYYRYPATPIWNYTLVNGRPQFTTNGSVDFEWQSTEITRLTMRILTSMGLSIRDTELTQAVEQMTQGAS